ncbi:hypothetical protein [uncultured Acinetobacter sp.]|uniref:hypothetical protein n=1 Tax=uncultured Acinetobacter sp. TaxID=165433 RepID=UPI002585FA54|nr:hypothetical protein [uncultured Acinetobacter sp.]
MMMPTPFAAKFSLLVLSCSILFVGCDQQPDAESTAREQSMTSANQDNMPIDNQGSDDALNNEERSSTTNLFYLLRDAADLQLKVGQAMQKLQATQSQLETALQEQDPQAAQQTLSHFKTQLTQFNDNLNQLQLKSPEVEKLRQQLINTNEQLLQSDLFQQTLNWKKQDIVAIQHQLNTLQTEMLKLAALIVNPNSTASSTDSKS